MKILEKVIVFLQAEMPRPKAFGWFHFLSLTITALLVIYFALTRKKNSETRLKRVLLIYGIVSLILELTKQIIWSYDGVWDFQWYAFPFQYCTTPLIVCIIYAFVKNEKVKEDLLSYLGFYTILGGIATMVMPDSCFVETIEVNIYTMFLHCGSFVVSLYILLGKYIKTSFKVFIKGFKVFLLFVILAQILNISIYNSGILNGETFNMFYISPYFNGTLPVFSAIQSKVPYTVFLGSYLFAVFMGAFIIYSIYKLCRRKK